MRDLLPISPAILAHLVAARQRLWYMDADLLEGFQTDRALVLINRTKELELLLKTIKNFGHAQIVFLGLPHHVVDEPFACIVRNTHGLCSVDAFHLFIHVIRDHWRHRCSAFLMELVKTVAHILELCAIVFI